MLKRTAGAVAAANARIRALLAAAWAVSCDETPIRVGAGKAKKYLLVACTALYTCYLLGDRTLATFKKFVIKDLAGVLVHDRYQNYDSAELGTHEHQLCAQHYAEVRIMPMSGRKSLWPAGLVSSSSAQSQGSWVHT
jgi:hypothetical protein